MAERKYSLSEIDAMRMALQCLLIHPGVPYQPVEKTKEIEEQLRTYMINGTDPEELTKAAARRSITHIGAALIAGCPGP
jgi:hypothetical protein